MAARNLQVHKPYPRSACPHCGMVARGAVLRSGAQMCTLCGRQFSADVFELPPERIVVKPVNAGGIGADASGAQASCAKHELNAASANCERCGNFICALCCTPMAGSNYCPACFERILEEGKADLRPAHETYYGGISFVLSVLGLLPPLGLVLGPVGVYYGVKGVRQCVSCRMPWSATVNAASSALLALLNALVCWGGLGVLIYLLVSKTKW